MKQSFPDREVLKEQIWDATIRNPESVMPPYGRHGVFTEEELERVVDYIHSL
jgi:sulfur-oxidizing protein SoxX